ncbi:MAG: hypothetical protein PWP74_457 [Shewanella sp.]|jgi:hypothetical protein|uniref:DUF2919 domain-containing protein n=1 Tax=Shewanella TaxID=22 RepID=UPI00167591DD|nr:DUF2919 domain-containing protein [Shewanella fodinae]MCL2907021.1 DUF2919 domain-containing protein [Shewanella fodinae]MDN5369149.1 hypothetical protein [Shewanella sp.]GGZ04511.1 hypothetical protein GCM10007169_21540 [Shewanella fodinae]
MFTIDDVHWLDDNGHVRPPLMLYLLLLFLARGWAILVMSLTITSDRAELVKLFYPEKVDFLTALAAGSGAVLAFFLVIAERRRKPQWCRSAFSSLRILLMGLLGLEAALLFTRLSHSRFLFDWPMALDGLFLFWSALYLYRSRHLKVYVSDWSKHAEIAEK